MTLARKRTNKQLAKWVLSTTCFTVAIITVCFVAILAMMIFAYNGREDISSEIVGSWKCVQFYRNQESFQVPDSQKITVIISDEEVLLQGSDNASIFRGADRHGTYEIEGGSTLLIDMGNAIWTCNCVFTSDGLLRITISEEETILYLERNTNNESN